MASSSHHCLCDNGEGWTRFRSRLAKEQVERVIAVAAFNHRLWGMTSEGLPVFASIRISEAGLSALPWPARGFSLLTTKPLPASTTPTSCRSEGRWP